MLCAHAKLLLWHWAIARCWAELVMVSSNHWGIMFYQSSAGKMCRSTPSLLVFLLNSTLILNAVRLACGWVRFRWIVLRCKLGVGQCLLLIGLFPWVTSSVFVLSWKDFLKSKSRIWAVLSLVFSWASNPTGQQLYSFWKGSCRHSWNSSVPCLT